MMFPLAFPYSYDFCRWRGLRSNWTPDEYVQTMCRAHNYLVDIARTARYLRAASEVTAQLLCRMYRPIRLWLILSFGYSCDFVASSRFPGLLASGYQ